MGLSVVASFSNTVLFGFGKAVLFCLFQSSFIIPTAANKPLPNQVVKERDSYGQVILENMKSNLHQWSKTFLF